MPPPGRESLFALMHPLMMVVVDVRLVLKPLLSLSVGSNGKDDTGLYASAALQFYRAPGG